MDTDQICCNTTTAVVCFACHDDLLYPLASKMIKAANYKPHRARIKCFFRDFLTSFNLSQEYPATPFITFLYQTVRHALPECFPTRCSSTARLQCAWARQMSPARQASDFGQCHSMLTLILPPPVLIGNFAHIIGLKKNNLSYTFVSINFCR